MKTISRSVSLSLGLVAASLTATAMADPLNIMALDDLRMLTSYEIEPVVAVASELRDAINRHR